MTLPELFAQCRERGLRVNNLFELDDGSWQANLRRPAVDKEPDIFETGRATPPQEALARALRAPVWRKDR